MSIDTERVKTQKKYGGTNWRMGFALWLHNFEYIILMNLLYDFLNLVLVPEKVFFLF